MTYSLLRTTALVLTGVLFASTTISPAEARDRERSGGFVTGKNRGGTYDNSVTGNIRDGRVRNQSVTTNSGKTFGRDTMVNYDKETGNMTKTVTGSNGNTRTYTGTVENGQVSGQYMTNSGKTGTYTIDPTRNADGTVSKNATWTGQDGVSKSVSSTSGYDAATGSVTRSVTGPNGNTHSGSVSAAPATVQ